MIGVVREGQDQVVDALEQIGGCVLCRTTAGGHYIVTTTGSSSMIASIDETARGRTRILQGDPFGRALDQTLLCRLSS